MNIEVRDCKQYPSRIASRLAKINGNGQAIISDKAPNMPFQPLSNTKWIEITNELRKQVNHRLDEKNSMKLLEKYGNLDIWYKTGNVTKIRVYIRPRCSNDSCPAPKEWVKIYTDIY